MSRIQKTDPNTVDNPNTLNDPVSVNDQKSLDDPGTVDDSIDGPVPFTVLDP